MLTLPAVASYIRERKLRAIAVQSGKRSLSFPDVPTLAEAGIPNHEVEFLVGFLAPAGTPKRIVDLLHRQIVKILGLSDVQERLQALALDGVGSTPEEFAMKIRVDYEKWRQVVRAAGLNVN
jgi:tripartite-type tricarboxylate transporter receptor subunit TctC